MYLLDFLEIFKSIKLINVIDFLIATVIVFLVLRTVRSSIAINIVVGLLSIYLLHFIVQAFKMPMLGNMLDKIVSVGLIGLIVVFQPEIRKFLISIGRNAPFRKNGLISKFMATPRELKTEEQDNTILQITKALVYCIKFKLGALIVVLKDENTEIESAGSVPINGTVSSKLIESIFEKTSPLHDGAIVINKNKIVSARTILPITDDTTLPSQAGLRHRAAVGASEYFDALIIIVSEEKNTISYAENGVLYADVNTNIIKQKLETIFENY
jgi:diadenylate cyclase